MSLALLQIPDVGECIIRGHVAAGWSHRLLLCEGEVHIVSLIVVLFPMFAAQILVR